MEYGHRARPLYSPRVLTAHPAPADFPPQIDLDAQDGLDLLSVLTSYPELNLDALVLCCASRETVCGRCRHRCRRTSDAALPDQKKVASLPVDGSDELKPSNASPKARPL